MKLVLSRKGFDSGYGGMPSPILPNGDLIPLPIPTTHDAHTFRDLDCNGVDLGKLLSDLSRGRLSLDTVIHLDPDLDRVPARRPSGWRPALGQTDGAATHLDSHGVGVGDVFLFFGWFRMAELAAGRWRYARRAPHLHVMFGWIEVGDVLRVVLSRDECVQRHPWIVDHPHVRTPSHYTDRRNTLYVAASSSRYLTRGQFGGGRFAAYAPELQLTRAGMSRSVWSLPAWFTPMSGRPPLSYHGASSRWGRDGSSVTLKSVAKGQEFVLDADAYPEAESWARAVINVGARA